MLIKTILQTPKQTLLLREQIFLQSLIKSISTKQKYIIITRILKIIIKKIYFSKIIFFFSFLSNIRIINLSLEELRLIAQIRNISDYENKSKEDLIKALSETKPKPETKPEIKPKQIPKPQAPKPKPKPEPEPKIRVKTNKRKLKKLRKDFDELRHKFSKKEIDRYRKAFYNVKNFKNLSILEIKEAGKSLTKLKKSLRFKKFRGNIDSVNYEDLDNYDYNYDFADDDEYRKIGSIRTLFKEFDRDYYKPIRTDGGFAGRNNNYIEYTSKGDRYENLSPKEYLNMIRPYLRDLINEHKPTVKLNNNSGNNNNNNNDNNNNNNNNNTAEWKIQLMENSANNVKQLHFY